MDNDGDSVWAVPVTVATEMPLLCEQQQLL